MDAEVRIGELMREVPKASGGDRRSENFKNNTDVTFEKQKKQVISDMGFTPMQVSRFETLAAHPEIVAQAKAEVNQMTKAVDHQKTHIPRIRVSKQSEDGHNFVTHDDEVRNEARSLLLRKGRRNSKSGNRNLFCRILQNKSLLTPGRK